MFVMHCLIPPCTQVLHMVGELSASAPDNTPACVTIVQPHTVVASACCAKLYINRQLDIDR